MNPRDLDSKHEKPVSEALPMEPNEFLPLPKKLIEFTYGFLGVLELMRFREALLSSGRKTPEGKREDKFAATHALEKLCIKARMIRRELASSSNSILMPVQILQDFIIGIDFNDGTERKVTIEGGVKKHTAERIKKLQMIRFLILHIATGNQHAALDIIKENKVWPYTFIEKRGFFMPLYEYVYLYNNQRILDFWWEGARQLVHGGADTCNFFNGVKGIEPLLVYAIKCNQPRMVSQLLLENPNIDLKNNVYDLIRRAQVLTDPFITKMLLDKKADPTFLPNDSVFPRKHSLLSYVSRIGGNAEVLSLLIEKKAEVNFKNSNHANTTALLKAALENKTECVQTLLQAKASCSLRNANNEVALHWAIQNNNIDCVQKLLEQQANESNGRDGHSLCAATYDSGNTPLHLALILKHENIVNLLLDVADKDQESSVIRRQLLHVNKDEKSVLILAAQLSSPQIWNKIFSILNRRKIILDSTTIVDAIRFFSTMKPTWDQKPLDQVFDYVLNFITHFDNKFRAYLMTYFIEKNAISNIKSFLASLSSTPELHISALTIWREILTKKPKDVVSDSKSTDCSAPTNAVRKI